MKQIVCILFCMLFSLTVSAQDKTDGLFGKWEFSATDVPYGYETGNIEFQTKEGKLNVILSISYNKITIDQIEQTGDTYKCDLNIEGSDVNISFKQKAGKLEADVTVDGSPIGISFKKME